MSGRVYIISATSLNLLLECPLCFYLKVKEKIDRPRPPTASITFGMDKVIKEYFNKCREKGILPPFLQKKLEGKKLALEKPLNLKVEYILSESPYLKLKLVGNLDECLVDEEGKYYPLDHKTRGYAPKQDSSSVYQLQMNIYSFLLKKNGFPIGGKGYLVYYFPQEIETPEWKEKISGEVFKFNFEIQEIEINVEEANELIWYAIRILKSPTPPSPSPSCSYCNWRRERSGVYFVYHEKKNKNTLFE